MIPEYTRTHTHNLLILEHLLKMSAYHRVCMCACVLSFRSGPRQMAEKNLRLAMRKNKFFDLCYCSLSSIFSSKTTTTTTKEIQQKQEEAKKKRKVEKRSKKKKQELKKHTNY